jgi:hypothetical protein
MSKIGSLKPFGHLQHKLWPKEKPVVKQFNNLTIWLPTMESRESTWFPCAQVACNMPLKSSQRRLQLCSRPCPDWRSATKVIVSQSCGTPILGDFRTPTWESRTKNHLDDTIVEWCKVYYMGEGGGFPRVRAMVSLVSPESPMACPSTKGAPEGELTNLLVGLMEVQVSN